MVIKLYEEAGKEVLNVKPCKLALRETDDGPSIVLVDEQGSVRVVLATWDCDGDLDVHVLDDVDIKIAKASGIGIDGAVMKSY